MKNRKIIREGVNVLKVAALGVFFMALVCGAAAADYYVDKNSLGGPASDKNPGTKEKPWKTIARAFGTNTPKPAAGDTVYVRDGVYRETVVINDGGAPGNPLVLKVFPGEQAVIDGEGKREYGILFPGPGADYGKGIMYATTGSNVTIYDGKEIKNTAIRNADNVTIDGFKLASIGSTNVAGTAISVNSRKGIIIQNVEIDNISDMGIFLNVCENCRILKSNIHHCNGPIYVMAPCSDITIADNEVHHSLKYPCIGLWGPADSVIFRGKPASIEPAGPGLARFTVADEKVLLNKPVSYIDHLRGQEDVAAGVVKLPSRVIFFSKEGALLNDNNEQDIIPGGTDQLMDGRKWFVMRNNPEWDNKPYSPDGKQGLFAIGQAKLEELAKAKYFYIARTFDPATRINRDIQILRNHVHDSAHQGILAPSADYVLMRGNRIHDNAVTGIQVETGSRHLWIEGNEIYANNLRSSGETCLWLDEDIDVVIQDNILSEAQTGLEVTQCSRVLARRNVIYDNRAQHNTVSIEEAGYHSSGIRMNGGRHGHLGAPPTVTESAFVHNTLYGNGRPNSICGGIYHGSFYYQKIGRNIILNNLVQGTESKGVMAFDKETPLRCDGNIYHSIHAQTEIIHAFPESKDKKIYSLSKPEDFDVYRKQFDLDWHSQVAEAAFVNAKAKDFHLAKGSVAIDKGVPLARTVSDGKGKELPVDNVGCFSAGFKNSKGDQLIPGDEIMIGKTRARVTAIDREKNLLVLDQIIRWKKDAPVNYVYNGSAPDVGAYEGE